MPLVLLLLCSVVTFFVLYAPQPLLVLFSSNFNVSPAQSGSLMSLTMLPLAIAPIVYGLFLAKRNVLLVLKMTMVGLAISCLLFVHVDSFYLLQWLRFIQGLLLPAALTSMTGYIGMRYQGTALQKNMSLYIGSTILGGYLGRVLSASFASKLDWQSFYYVIAVLLVLLSCLIKPSNHQAQIKAANSPKDYLRPLKNRALISLYLAVFCMFFCFAGLMNFLPFILQDTFAITDPKDVGLVYTGYLVGAALSVASPWIVKKCPSASVFIFWIFILYVMTLTVMQFPSFWLFITAFTLFCMAMFMIHTTAAGFANHLSQAPSTVTNGAYVSFYYSGGALGSFLPGFAFEHFGTHGFLLTLTFVCLLGTWCITQVKEKTDNVQSL
ncbi:MFS transporter [Pseudoalteromonas xiamenensis]